MFSFNRVHIIGYQTQPVQVRQTPSGTSVTDLNLAVPYRFKTESGETLDAKGFHTVTLWGSMADVAGKFLRVGGQVFISGRLQTDSWEDTQSGEKRSKTKIVGLDMILLDPKDGQLPPPPAGVSALVNRVDIIGNATREPEMRTTTNGQQVLSLGVATNERWRDRTTNEDKERSEFHNVVVWGKLAEDVSKAVKKGNRVFVSGRVQTRSWETKDGQKRYTTEIVADTVSLLGAKNPQIEANIRADGQPVRESAESQSPESAPVGEAELPDIPEVAYASEIKAEDLPF